MKAHSYGLGGQDPRKLLKKFDKDGGGELDMEEFTEAIRKGGHLTKKDISDDDLHHVFQSFDVDGDGSVGIDELTDVVWQTSYAKHAENAGDDGDAEFLAAEKEAAQGDKWQAYEQAERDRARLAQAVEPEPELEPEPEPQSGASPDVLGQLSHARAEIEQMRTAMDELGAVSISEAELRTENGTLRAELAAAQARLGGSILSSTAQKMVSELDGRASAAEAALATARDEAAELRAANEALEKAMADAAATNAELTAARTALEKTNVELTLANGKLTKSNEELGEVNAKLAADSGLHSGVGRPEWLERDFASPRDRDLTFDVTCKLMDEMRVELATHTQKHEVLESRIAELTADLDAAKAAAAAAAAAAGPTYAPQAGSPSSQAGSPSSRGSSPGKLVVQGTADLRDEVMAVAERLVQRSQVRNTPPFPPPCNTFLNGPPPRLFAKTGSGQR
jgi:hypothetical protein